MLWQPLLCGLNPSFKTNGIATALFQIINILLLGIWLYVVLRTDVQIIMMLSY